MGTPTIDHETFYEAVDWLLDVRRDANLYVLNANETLIEDENGQPSIDVRVQRFDGEWFFHSGDAQYDTDHRGFWGSGKVVANLIDLEDGLELLADDLLMQALNAQEE